MADPVVVVLGRGRVPAGTPILRADDLGVLRGDGVFETLHVRGGRPWLLGEHLARMATSANRLALDLPEPVVLRELAGQAYDGWPADVEGALRLVCTRGPEDGGPVTVYATMRPISPVLRAARRNGVRLATATLGITAGIRPKSPWLLGGVKALSYAVNMASLRWADAQALDDVLWTSADGYALEAPTSSLVWLDGDELCTVPAEATGVLPGTTAGWLLAHAGQLGWRAAQRLVRPAELADADGAWLTSSVRGAAPVRQLDGVEFRRSPATAAIQQLLGHPI
jgi:4-amino-4-deoxychorismate lyase